jgi:uncharacterized short protein YbdD (DUF466 family)
LASFSVLSPEYKLFFQEMRQNHPATPVDSGQLNEII